MRSACPPRQERGGQKAGRDGSHHQRAEGEGGEEPPAEVVGLADGRGVDERMHPRLHVSRCRIAGQSRGDQ